MKNLISKVSCNPELKEYQPQLFIEIVNTVTNLIATVEALGQLEYLNNPMLVDQFLSKLPFFRKLQWATFIQNRHNTMDFKKFTTWLEDQASIVSMVCDFVTINPGKSLIGAIGELRSKTTCAYCEGEHPASHSERLKTLSLNERWRWV